MAYRPTAMSSSHLSIQRNSDQKPQATTQTTNVATNELEFHRLSFIHITHGVSRLP